MRLNSWDLRDPASALHTVHRLVSLRPGHVVLALFEQPSRAQRLLDATLVSTSETPPPNVDRLATLLGDAARGLFAGRSGRWPPVHAFAVIVARRGRVVFRPADLAWSKGLAYASHLEPAFNGELVLVTQHGFRCFGDSTAGRHPALAPG